MGINIPCCMMRGMKEQQVNHRLHFFLTTKTTKFLHEGHKGFVSFVLYFLCVLCGICFKTKPTSKKLAGFKLYREWIKPM